MFLIVRDIATAEIKKKIEIDRCTVIGFDKQIIYSDINTIDLSEKNRNYDKNTKEYLDEHLFYEIIESENTWLFEKILKFIKKRKNILKTDKYYKEKRKGNECKR